MGLDPLAFLNTKDGFDRGLMIELAKQALEYRSVLDKNLAGEIASAVNKLFSK